MSTQQAAQVLEDQCADFRRLHDLGLEQRNCILREDVQGLQETLARMHPVMDSIRLREKDIPDSRNCDAVLLETRERLRALIVDVQVLRQRNQASAERLRDATRDELQRLRRGRQAARGYGSAASPGSARLFDGTR